MPASNVLVYILRRDLRLEDNPIFHESAKQEPPTYTHLLPLYVFSAQQLEVSGFLPKNTAAKSPYQEARSKVGGFWRCGPHRAKFVAESVWNLKEKLEEVGSGLEIRVGMVGEVIRKIVEGISKEEGDTKIGAVWMTAEEGREEKMEERDVRKACEEYGIEFRLFKDEKYFIDDRDVPFTDPQDLPDVFTTYRKTVEPLRDAPRDVLLTPEKSSLPPMPPPSSIPAQHGPFVIPSSYSDLEFALVSPVQGTSLANPPQMPPKAESAHPFHGGSKAAQDRLQHLIASSSMTGYKDSRNGLLGLDYSTKLSAWLALGCLTARQVHLALLNFEDAKTDLGADQESYGKGENEGTKAVRFELLWRDYMRLCTRKFGHRLFRLGGFRADTTYPWKHPSSPQHPSAQRTLERFLEGTTGMGLIDASQRELYLTGYTSNRARQNVASFLTKHLQLDWRLGAEWYECMLVDYDVCSNWGNWQYVAGVGNDPRGEARVFNPVKQAFDYDPQADYVRAWISELAGVRVPAQAFQAWTMPEERRLAVGLRGVEWAERPLKKIHFVMGPGRHGGGGGGGGSGGGGGPARGGGGDGRPFRGGRGRGGGGGESQGRGGRGWHSGSGGGGRYGGSSRPYHRGRGRGTGAGGGGGGREARTGPAEKDSAAAADAAADDAGQGGDDYTTSEQTGTGTA